MKVNWKVRLKNGPWLMSFISMIVTFVFSMLDMLGVIPDVTQDSVLRVVNQVLMLLATFGVITDPTQAKLMTDSQRAMGYDEPWQDVPAYDLTEQEINNLSK